MRFRRALFALPLLAFVTACFDGPVRETWTLKFLANGWVIAGRTIVLSSTQDSNPAVARRLAAVRRDLIEGTDAWSLRLSEIAPIAERIEQEKVVGAIANVSHRALLGETDQVRQLFAATPIGASYRLSGGIAELSLIPGPADRATRADRQKVQLALPAWSAEVASYLAAGRSLWAYLDEHPERSAACFGSLFRQIRADDAPEPPPLREGRETQLVEVLSKAMKAVWQPLEVADGEAFTLDELSHLVFDPFPAPIEVHLPGSAIEVEGFKAENGALVARGPGFWNALERLEGRWLAPDPVFAFVRESRKPKQAFDLEGFLRLERRAETTPSGREVQAALQAGLNGAPEFRATWKVATDGDQPAEPKDDFLPWQE